MNRATCPICHRTVNTCWSDRGVVFVRHFPARRCVGPRCEGTAWLVEDDEVVS